MEKSRENPSLKPYIEQFIIETLENCELFVKEFGKGFAKESLKNNFKTLLTEGSDSRAAGQYSLSDAKSITLFSKGKNGNLLTFEDIEENPHIKSTILHEGIHAVLNKTPEECKALGIARGTGFHALFKSGNSELGRAANEGYTNWLCEKAGYKTNSYFKFTGIIKLLEMAIGEENIIKFGKGDIKNNIAPLLDMDPEECAIFFSKADSIYDYDDKSNEYFEIKSALKYKLDYQDKPENIPAYMVEIINKLNNSELYKNILTNSEYIRFAEQENLDPNDEKTKLEFFTKVDKYYQNKSENLLAEIHEEIINKYFMKELEDIDMTKDYSVEHYKKFAKIAGLLGLRREPSNETIKNFKQKYELLRTDFCEKVFSDIKNSIIDGTISSEKICYYVDILSNGDSRSLSQLEDTISKYMLPEDSSTYFSLFNSLSYYKKLDQLLDYKIIKIENDSGKTKSLFINQKTNESFAKNLSIGKTLLASDEIEDTESIIDITLTNLQSMQEIVKNFLVLKEEIKTKSPNAQIQIVDDIIISTNEENESIYYMIEGNEIVPAKAQELITQNRRPKDQIYFPEEEAPLTEEEAISLINQLDNKFKLSDNTQLKPISQNPFKRLFESMRGKLLNIKKMFSKDDKDAEKTDLEISEIKVSDNNSFDDRIHVDVSGKYDPTIGTQEKYDPTVSLDDFSK